MHPRCANPRVWGLFIPKTPCWMGLVVEEEGPRRWRRSSHSSSRSSIVKKNRGFTHEVYLPMVAMLEKARGFVSTSSEMINQFG